MTGLADSLSATTAGAAESREAREREARKACFTGNVERAVEILVDLYVETQHPTYIYNQARCFERNGKYDQALLSYEDYLRKATDTRRGRTRPGGKIDRRSAREGRSDARARRARRARAARPRCWHPRSMAPAPAPAATPNEAPLLPAPGEDRASAPRWPWQRTAGVMSLIAAGGGLVLGVAGTVLRQGRADDFNAVCTNFNGQPVPIDPSSTMDFDCRGKYESVQAAERMMWIGYLSGGVLAGAGVTLLLIAPRTDRPPALAWARRCVPTMARGSRRRVRWSF